jgi:hypothetical protein
MRKWEVGLNNLIIFSSFICKLQQSLKLDTLFQVIFLQKLMCTIITTITTFLYSKIHIFHTYKVYNLGYTLTISQNKSKYFTLNNLMFNESKAIRLVIKILPKPYTTTEWNDSVRLKAYEIILIKSHPI